MQKVPIISQDLFDALGNIDPRLNVLIEFYENDKLPAGNGFDPTDAILRVANKPTTFLGFSYARYVEQVGTVNRSITPQFNTISVDLNNHDRTMATFVITNPPEGMYLVVRLISRSFTATGLDDSFVVFTGKCDKVFDADSQKITISAKQYIGSTEEEIPWRTFTPEDERGVDPDDPLFEGFPFTVHRGELKYRERVPRGGFLGLLGFKKSVTRTLQFTNHQGINIETAVPLILGRAQVQWIPVAYIDVGGQINAIFCVGEGPIKAFYDWRCITDGFQFAAVADNNPEINQFRYGYDGNTNGQVPFLDNLTGGIPANGYYSRSAMFSGAFYGTDVSQEDPAPEVISIILGMIVPMPDEDGVFNLEDFTDNPAILTRWLLTKDRSFNLDPAFINDPQCVKTACYCDGPVLDNTNGELIVLPNSESGSYGVNYRRYHSTGLLSPEYFKHYFLNDGQDPLPELTLPSATFYDPTAGKPSLSIIPLARRRFTANIYLKDKMKSADFLFKVLLPTYRGFLTQNAQGKIDIKCRRPGDSTTVRTASVATDMEIEVQNVLPWIADLTGEVIVGNDLLTSEVREVTGVLYSADGNSITLAVTGNLTRSGTTFSGGDDNNPAIGSVTVTGLGTLTVTINGHSVSYTTVSADTTGTAAAMLAQFLKADPILNAYIKTVWDKDTPTVISFTAKLGVLELSSALEEAHDLDEEILRIQMSFADRLFTPADLLQGNILRGSFKWPIGAKQSSVNRIDGTYIDSPQDFIAQPLRTRDPDHIAQVGKVLPEELTLTGVDNFNQAKRLENSLLAERRDLDFYMQETSDRRAMLLEEGDLICNTHRSGDFRNVALRVEEVSLDLGKMTVRITAKRYSTSAYTDDAPARQVPLPTGLSTGSGPPSISFNTTDYLPSGLIQTTTNDAITSIRGGAIFGASIYGQRAKVSLKRPGETDFTQLAVIEPDADRKAVFEFIASDAGIYTVQLEVCFTSGVCNPTKPTASLAINLGGAVGRFVLASDNLNLWSDAFLKNDAGSAFNLGDSLNNWSDQIDVGGEKQRAFEDTLNLWNDLAVVSRGADLIAASDSINNWADAISTSGSPSDIPNIWEWWEPSREGYANDDPIDTLTGQFAAKNFTGSGATRPIFKTNILNGLAVANFSSQSMSGPNASALTAGHIFIVLKAVNDPGLTDGSTPEHFGTDSNPDLWPFTDGKVYMGAGRAITRFATNVNPTPSLAAWRVLEVVTTSSEYSVYMDGSLLATTATNTVGFNTALTLGAKPASKFWSGQQAGIYIFSAKLSSGDRTAMVDYLNTRFGLSIS